MVHAETDSLLQMLKQAQKMEELLKQLKSNTGLSVSMYCCPCPLCYLCLRILALVECAGGNDILLIVVLCVFCFLLLYCPVVIC